MSFLHGKSNILSIISKNIINHVKTTSAINSKLLGASQQSPVLFTSMPTNLISNSSLDIDCGDMSKCSTCLKNNNIDINDFETNIDKINELRNNECFSVCSCNLKNINMENDLVFLTGISINFSDGDKKTISSNVKADIQTVSLSKSSSKESPEWGSAILGGGAGALLAGPEGLVAGAALGAAVTGLEYAFAPTYDSTVDEKVESAVYNMSQKFQNTINQLLSSSQDINILGTGVKVKNISLKTVQDITMNSSQNNSVISDITNGFIQTGTANQIQSQTSSMVSYLWGQNKNLIIGSIVFISLLFIVSIILMIKSALKK